MEDKFVRDLGAADSSHSGSISPALSHNPTSSPALALALISTPVLVLTPALGPSDKLFRQFMKAYLESQGPSWPLAECKQSLKAKVPDIYYGRLHMDCYHFCQ